MLTPVRAPPCPASFNTACDFFMESAIAIREPADSKPPLRYLGKIPRAIRELSHQLEYGDKKPGRAEGDWKDVKDPFPHFVEKAMRHLLERLEGKKLDDDGRSNLAAAMANIAIAIEREDAS